jgi:hypothetical protein
MAVAANTRVVPEAMEATYERLKQALARHGQKQTGG